MPFRDAEAITRTIRECCHHLDALDDALRHDIGITAAMRVVLETLHESGAKTVPQIARANHVTRQHIQTLADRLLASGLVSSEENPRDRRSPLLALTKEGEAAYERLRGREIEALTDLSRGLKECDTDAALKTLQTLQSQLNIKLGRADHRRS